MSKMEYTATGQMIFGSEFFVCDGVAIALPWLCNCCVTNCVGALRPNVPPAVPSAVEKSFNLVRSKASGLKNPLRMQNFGPFEWL